MKYLSHLKTSRTGCGQCLYYCIHCGKDILIITEHETYCMQLTQTCILCKVKEGRLWSLESTAYSRCKDIDA
jgi:hypothetical protein